MFDRNETIWGSADGTEYLVKDLTTPHLVNILNWVKKHNVHSRSYPEGLYEFLEGEAAYRVMFAFCLNEPMPFKLDSGWWALKNIGFWLRAKSLFYKYKTELKIKHQNHKLITKLLNFKLFKVPKKVDL